MKYLFLLIFKGEKTSKELSIELKGSIYSASHSLAILHALGLVRHPARRPRSWEVIPSQKINSLIEKLLLMSKNDQGITALFNQRSIVKIGSRFHGDKKGKTISELVESTRLSRISVTNALDKIIKYALLRSDSGKPNRYYITHTPISGLFFEICNQVEKFFLKNIEKEITPKNMLKRLKEENTVLMLIHYGSSARGKADTLSDMDIMAVTRDRLSRGDILTRYSQKNVDLSVYSKSGFLKLLKSQPHFINAIATAKILKGKDIFEAVTG